jgi:hypothetical protein
MDHSLQYRGPQTPADPSNQDAAKFSLFPPNGVLPSTTLSGLNRPFRLQQASLENFGTSISRPARSLLPVGHPDHLPDLNVVVSRDQAILSSLG